MVWFGSYWLGIETVLRDRFISKFAIGWKVLSVFGLAAVYQMGLNKMIGAHYSPLLGAYLRKYSEFGTTNPQEIQDRKREFYQIDTTQYMSYSEEDLDIHGHANHGPQPVSTSSFVNSDSYRMEKHSTEPGSQSWANSSTAKRTNSKTTRGSMETRATLSSTRASQLSIRPKISSRSENVHTLAAI